MFVQPPTRHLLVIPLSRYTKLNDTVIPGCKFESMMACRGRESNFTSSIYFSNIWSLALAQFQGSAILTPVPIWREAGWDPESSRLLPRIEFWSFCRFSCCNRCLCIHIVKPRLGWWFGCSFLVMSVLTVEHLLEDMRLRTGEDTLIWRRKL